MRLIDKEAVLAEIDKLQLCTMDEHMNYYSAEAQGEYNALSKLESFLDSLEVKEVDLETQIEDYINSHFTEGCDGGMISDWYKVLGGVHYKDLVEIAKHFFELGMQVSNKAQKGE